MNPRYPSLTVAIKSPRPRGGGAGQYGLVLIILPDDQRSMVRRVVGANEAGGKEGPRGGIFLRFRAQDENAANAVDLQPTHNGESGRVSKRDVHIDGVRASRSRHSSARRATTPHSAEVRRLGGGDPLPSQWRDWLTPTARMGGN
jgi:hypothetical protein